MSVREYLKKSKEHIHTPLGRREKLSNLLGCWLALVTDHTRAAQLTVAIPPRGFAFLERHLPTAELFHRPRPRSRPCFRTSLFEGDADLANHRMAIDGTLRL
jgi:hypothetical protein